MKRFLHSHHPVRIFFITGFITLASLVFIGLELGVNALFIAIVLMIVEITFSFDNAIINAKILTGMSKFWQTLFITVGMVIAVFGMRLVFPILIVMITAGLGGGEVIDLALNNPKEYSQKLHDSHIAISSFGGMFLTMLCLHFFFDKDRKVRWISIIEKPLQHLGRWHIYSLTALIILSLLSFAPFNDHGSETFAAGLTGIITYMVIHGLAELFTRRHEKDEKTHKGGPIIRTGMAGFMSFLYLEILDASFSFDGVIGAFAITQDVILIAIGLGIGALWVRSLTIFMVRKQTLQAYRYLEHGAHYTIGILAAFLLSGLFLDIPEVVAGVTGLVVVGASIFSSVRASKRDALQKA